MTVKVLLSTKKDHIIIFSSATSCDALENQTLPVIVAIKKQYSIFEESESANF